MPSLASQLLHGDLIWPGPSTWWGGAGQGSSRAPASCLLSALGHPCPHLHHVPYKGCAVFSYKSPTGGQTHSYQPSFSGGFLKRSFKAPGLGLFETRNWTTQSLSFCEGFGRVSTAHCLRSQQVNWTCQENTQDKILHSELFIFLKKTMFIHIFE